LSAAREKAREAEKIVAEGLDPIVERDRKMACHNFKELAVEYIDHQKHSWRNKERMELVWLQSINDYCKPLHFMQPAMIQTSHVVECLKPIWLTKPTASKMLLNRIKRILDYGRVSGSIPLNSFNVATYEGTIQHMLPRQPSATSYASMPYEKVPEFVAGLRQLDRPTARLLEMIILTGLRVNEAAQAGWSEIDLDKAIMTIPASRMKGKVEHVVPLTAPVLALLRVQLELTGGKADGYVFVGRRGAEHVTARALNPIVLPYTTHGMRASLRQFLSEQTDTSFEIAENILAHAVGNSVTRSYLRSQSIAKMGAALKQWAHYIG
jgi:integrase